MNASLSRAALMVGACFLSSSALHAGVTYNVPPDVAPSAIVAGDVLNLFNGGGTTDGFSAAPGSIVNVDGGAVGMFSTLNGELNLHSGSTGGTSFATGAKINVFGGLLGQIAFIGGELNVLGGEVAPVSSIIDSTVQLEAGVIGIIGGVSGSSFAISGGTVFGTFFSPQQSAFTMSGGSIGDIGFGFESSLNMSGGTILPAAHIAVFPDAELSLIVRSAQLNGLPVPGLSTGSSIELDVTSAIGGLSGVLKDGSPFNFELTLQDNSDLDGGFIITDPAQRVDRGPAAGPVTVRLTLVPEPSALALWFTAGLACISLRTCSDRWRRS